MTAHAALDGIAFNQSALGSFTAGRAFTGRKSCVRRNEANPDITVCSPLDPTAGEDPVGVAVDHQRQHHPWVILRRARAALVHIEGAQIDTLHRLDHEVPQITRREPVPQIWRKQKRLVPITLDEVAHSAILRETQTKVRQTASPSVVAGGFFLDGIGLDNEENSPLESMPRF